MCYPISSFEFSVSASDFQIRRPIFNQKTYPISGKSVNLWLKDAIICFTFYVYLFSSMLECYLKDAISG